MSFRFELKSFGSYSACKNFILQLSKRGLENLYDQRFITMYYKTFESYINSKIEWLGDIPYHWNIKKISSICKEMGSGLTPK